MTPEHLGWVEISDHARVKMNGLGVPDSLAIGRIRNLHGICFTDTVEGGYNLYCPNLDDLVLAFEVQYNNTGYDNKQAVVKTVFECADPTSRFNSDRFEEYRGHP